MVFSVQSMLYQDTRYVVKNFLFLFTQFMYVYFYGH
jgi:hypothetical protein